MPQASGNWWVIQAIKPSKEAEFTVYTVADRDQRTAEYVAAGKTVKVSQWAVDAKSGRSRRAWERTYKPRKPWEK